MTFQPQEIDLKYYGLLLRRRYRLIAGTVAGCLLAAVLLNVATKPVYRATTRIEVRKEPNRSALTGEAIASYGWNSDNVALYTAAELITNRALLRDVVMALRSNGNLEIGPPRRNGLLSRLAGHAAVANAAESGGAGPSDGDVNRDIDLLLRITRVKPINETRLVMIQVDHWVPRTAKAIADTLAAQFVVHEERKRAAVDDNRLVYLKKQLEEMRAKIEDQERMLYSSHELGLTVLDGKLKQLTESVGHLNEVHINTKTDRLAIEARLKLVREALTDKDMSWDEVPVENETVQGLWRELVQTRIELARSREVYRAKHPKLMILESQLQSLQESIRAELRKAVGSLEAEYTMLKSREAGLERTMTQTEGQLNSTNDRHGKHTAMESELKSNREIYALMTQKAQELQITGEVQQPLVGVVEAATIGARPVRPRPMLNLVMGVIVGLTGGVGLAFLMEFLRRTIKTPKDLTEVLNLPILGMIPKAQS